MVHTVCNVHIIQSLPLGSIFSGGLQALSAGSEAVMLLYKSTFGSRSLDKNSVCLRCLLRLSDRSSTISKRFFRTSSPGKDSIVIKVASTNQDYFSANGLLSFPKKQSQHEKSPSLTRHEAGVGISHGRPSSSISHPSSAVVGSIEEESSTLIHPPEQRRLHRTRLIGKSSSILQPAPFIATDVSSLPLSSPPTSSPPRTSLRRLLKACLSLSKPRLSFLMVLTTAAAYSLYPTPDLLLPSTTTSSSLSAMTLVLLTTGTALCSASANALNMVLEPEHDAKMSRTRNRPIVRGLIGKKGAVVFASAAGLVGTGCLWLGVNPTVAFLGALNIGLYAGVYTPLKRISSFNTWVGALVGGIPPLMGWAAAAGQNATIDGGWSELLFSHSSIGGWLLAGLLYAWQFPHFNGLSWTIREEYKHAGHQMLAWTNPRMNGRVALRYAVLLFPICAGLWWFEITDQGFLITSSIVNAWIVREAWRFWKREGQRGSARGLFWASIWHLPVIMVLAMVHKKGLWEGIWQRAGGASVMDGDETEAGSWENREEEDENVTGNQSSL